jgi:hypothetical protein
MWKNKARCSRKITRINPPRNLACVHAGLNEMGFPAIGALNSFGAIYSMLAGTGFTFTTLPVCPDSYIASINAESSTP